MLRLGHRIADAVEHRAARHAYRGFHYRRHYRNRRAIAAGAFNTRRRRRWLSVTVAFPRSDHQSRIPTQRVGRYC